jgi:hypothetical protein
MDDDMVSNVFTIASSPPSSKGGKISSISNISKKLFNDSEESSQPSYVKTEMFESHDLQMNF